VRQWGLKIGREIARCLRHREPRRGDKSHLDEVVLTIAGMTPGVSRAVDRGILVLNVPVLNRPDDGNDN